MKFVLKLFGRADGGDSAFDVMVVDAKKILGFRTMPALTHAGIFGFALHGAIWPLHFKGIVTGGARFRPPLFTLEKNGIVFGALGCHSNISGLIIGLPGARLPLDRELLEFPGSVGINRLAATTMNIHKSKQRQYQNGCDTGCGNFHGVSPRWVKPVYISSYNKCNELSIHFHLQIFSFYIRRKTSLLSRF
jgi:hypothetical protein